MGKIYGIRFDNRKFEYNSLAAADESNRTIDTPAAVDSVPNIAIYNVAFPSETELLSAIRKAEFA